MYLLFFFQVFALSSSLTLGSWLMLNPPFSPLRLIEAVMISLGAGTIITMVVGALRQGALHPAASLADNLGISAREIIYVPITSPVSIHSLAHSLSTMGWKLRQQQDDALSFRTRISWASWGEVVTLRWEQVDDQSALLHLHSRPWLPTSLIDYGKNQRNLSLIHHILTGRGAGY